MLQHHKIGWALLAWSLVLPPLARGEDSWLGKQVMPKESGVRIGYTDTDGRPRYVATLTDMTYTVEHEQGSWITVRHRGISGWLAKKDAVPVEEAIHYFTARIRQNEKDANAYARRAEAWKAKGEHDIAIKDYHEAIRLQPEQKAWYNNRGNALQAKGEYDRAIADYDEAIRLDPKNFLAYYNRGLSWSAKGEYDRAIADYDEAIRLDPMYTRAFNSRGNARLAKKQYDRAIADYTEAIRLDSRHAWAFNNRGKAWEAKMEYDRAIADYTEAIRLDPKDAWPFYNRGKAWQAKGKYDRAIADYDEAVRLDPKNARAINNQAWLWATCPSRNYRDGKRAVQSARRACELTGWKVPYFFHTLAAAFAESGNFDEAVKWQKRALEAESALEKHAQVSFAEARERLRSYEDRKSYQVGAE